MINDDVKLNKMAFPAKMATIGSNKSILISATGNNVSKFHWIIFDFFLSKK